MTKDIKKSKEVGVDIFKEFGKIKSFGGKTLNQNLELTRNAIAEIQPLQKIFDRQHSQFQTTFFIVGKHATLGRSIRQIVSEVHHKEEALLDNLHKLSLKEVDIEEWRLKLETEDNIFERKRLELNINFEEINRQRSLEPIQGTMRDILILKRRFDEIYKEMSEKDIEEEEVTYWILRLCSQAMRFVRQSGRMDEGNQLALEQIGINPHYVQRRMLEFLQKEEQMIKPTTEDWNKEMALMVEEFKDVPKQFARIRNMDLGIHTDAIYEEDF